MRGIRPASALLLPLLFVPLARAQQFHEREVMIPWAEAMPQGLDALLVYADLPGKHPLAILTHGTSRQRESRDEVSPWSMLPQATWFARRGWLALVVVRRGYGRSGGRPDYASNDRFHPSYVKAGEASADDLRAAIRYGSKLPEVDPTHMLCAGVSTGGFATVALTAEAPPGLVAAINFAGGRGSMKDHEVRDSGELVGAFHEFGKHSRTPMLWIYAENDKYFWPELAAKFDHAFKSAGGRNEFVKAPPVGDDGHSLFRRVAAWSDTVDAFLKAQGLVFLPEPLPAPPVPDTPPPAGLSDTGMRAFHAYLQLGPYKAFAVSEHGFGMATAQLSADEAKRKALDLCRHNSREGQCRIVYVNDRPAE